MNMMCVMIHIIGHFPIDSRYFRYPLTSPLLMSSGIWSRGVSKRCLISFLRLYFFRSSRSFLGSYFSSGR